MVHYQLIFPETQSNQAEIVEFDAFDAAMALITAYKRASKRSAQLWSDGKKLCEIRRGPVADIARGAQAGSPLAAG